MLTQAQNANGNMIFLMMHAGQLLIYTGVLLPHTEARGEKHSIDVLLRYINSKMENFYIRVYKNIF